MSAADLFCEVREIVTTYAVVWKDPRAELTTDSQQSTKEEIRQSSDLAEMRHKLVRQIYPLRSSHRGDAKLINAKLKVRSYHAHKQLRPNGCSLTVRHSLTYKVC